MDFSESDGEHDSHGGELVSGERESFRAAREGCQFVYANVPQAQNCGSGYRLAKQLYPSKAEEVSAMYRTVCQNTGKNHRGVHRRAYIAACVLYVSVKDSSAYLPTAYSNLLDEARLTSTQLLRAIQTLMSMGIRWCVPLDFTSMVARPAREHGFQVTQSIDLPESGRPSDTAAAFYLCTDASLAKTASLFGLQERQLVRAVRTTAAVSKPHPS